MKTKSPIKSLALGALILLLSSQNVLALSIGTAPGFLDLGKVEPGKDYVIEYYLLTTSKDTVVVTASYVAPGFDFYTTRNLANFDPKEASQEDISDWLEFVENPIVIPPGNRKTVVLPTGATASYNKKMTIVLHVPDDAEPGYHLGSINLNPKFMTSGGGPTSVATIGVTRPYFMFYVERRDKKPVRSGKIMMVQAKRGSDHVRMDVVFMNNGTDTVYARVTKLKVYEEKDRVREYTTGYQKVPPGQPVIFSVVDKNGLHPGSYPAEVTVNYLTGSVTKTATIEIPAEITLKPLAPPKEECKFPWLVFLGGLLLVGVGLSANKRAPMRKAIYPGTVLVAGSVAWWAWACKGLGLADIPWWLLLILISLVGLYIYWKS